jgi:hypothetical protein
MDSAAYRYQRILYPALGRVFSFGQESLVAWILLGINVFAYAVGAGLLAQILRGFGAQWWAAFAYTLWMGNLYALRFGLAELLCFALALAAILAYQKQRWRASIVFLVLSALTKEIGIVFAGALALHLLGSTVAEALSSGNADRLAMLKSAFIAGVPVAAFVGWGALLTFWLGESPTSPGAASFNLIPFVGLGAENSVAELVLLFIWLVIPATALFIAAVVKWVRTRDLSLAISLVLLCAYFVAGMPGLTWRDPVAAYRVGTPLLIGGLIFVTAHYPRWTRWFVMLWSVSSVIFFLLLNALGR